jgi:hypothetical protein
VGLATAALVAYWFALVFVQRAADVERWIEHSHRSLWVVTIPLVVATTAVAAYVVGRHARAGQIPRYLRDIGWRRLVLGTAICAGVVALRMLWVSSVASEPGMSPLDMPRFYAALALRAPGWNLVHHVVYFGPIFLVVLAAWPRIARIAGATGPAAILALGFVVLLAITPESRHLIHVFPPLVVLAVTATQSWWNARMAVVFALVSLAWSKTWWVFGYDRAIDSFAWPDLRYMMHHGIYASDATFAAHLGAAFLTALILRVTWRTARRGC